MRGVTNLLTRLTIVFLLFLLPSSWLQAAPPAAPLGAPCQAGGTYQPACDLDHDGDVDITDIQLAAGHWGQSGTYVETSWLLTGNTGTIAGTNFVGTADNTALEFKVNAQRGLRLEPNANSPNLIGGYSGNFTTPGVAGGTVGGGGNSGNPNRVTDNYGAVGGGLGNLAGDNAGTTADNPYATVGGGMDNFATGAYSFVGGGTGNRATSLQATVAGGGGNQASNTSATVAGGASNTADGFGATVAGGVNNRAGGSYSFAAGFRAKALHDGSFVWADATNSDFSSTSAGQFAVRANGGVVFSTGGAPITVNGSTAWHAGNDGSGSGLDADTLDGQHGDYYRVFVVSSAADATTYLDATCRNYSDGQITITVPRNGTVVVEANARMRLGHTNGTTDLMTLNLDTTTTNCYSYYDLVSWTIPAAYPTSDSEDYTFTVRRAFPVNTGTHTFYLNGVMDSGGGNGSDYFWLAQLHATFYPESVAAEAPAPLKEDAP